MTTATDSSAFDTLCQIERATRLVAIANDMASADSPLRNLLTLAYFDLAQGVEDLGRIQGITIDTLPAIQ